MVNHHEHLIVRHVEHEEILPVDKRTSIQIHLGWNETEYTSIFRERLRECTFWAQASERAKRCKLTLFFSRSGNFASTNAPRLKETMNMIDLSD